MYTKKQREEILAEFGASDLSAYAFCRQAGLSRVTLRAWQREAAARAKLAALFARVVVVPEDSPRTPLELHIGRVRVVVPATFDPAQLRAVLDAIGALS